MPPRRCQAEHEAAFSETRQPWKVSHIPQALVVVLMAVPALLPSAPDSERAAES